LQSFNTNINIKQYTNGAPNDKAAATMIGTAVGGLMGFMIYIIIFIYGTMVMRSVVEEKTNRIVEIIISSVKPFQLMLGKIVGVGLVGVTQIVAWLFLIGIGQLILGLFFNIDANSLQTGMQPNIGAPNVSNMEQAQLIQATLAALSEQNWLLISVVFIFYFLGGYFLYAALFAAIGSAVGDEVSDNQAITLPITIPVILAFYIMIAVIQNPNSSLATWSSLFPLFSPIIMPARIPFGVPAWEIILSMLILLGTCIGTIWLSGRIYRVGILLYGKKVTLRELGKWLFMKQ
jgi:ABC-2 type transport system permease protein